jgi:hypothetical protein
MFCIPVVVSDESFYFVGLLEVMKHKPTLFIIRRQPSHLSEQNNVSSTFALELTMTDDKPCADNADGVEDKLKGCYNLRRKGGAQSIR